jgi:hypothetical protein
MWSTNQNVWKRANVCGEAVSSPLKHTGMSAANQRGRRSVLRQRRVAKVAAQSKALQFALANITILEQGGQRGKSN